MFNDSNRGQMNFIFGIMMLVFVIVMFGALYPTIVSAFQGMRGSNAANCVGSATYNASIASDSLACTVSGFGPGMILLAIVFGLIAAVIAGKMMSEGSSGSNPYGG